MSGQCPFPSVVADLPVCPKRKLPIPFSAVHNEDGTGNFSLTDAEAIERCNAERLCGVCGKPLTYWIVFLGGARSAEPNGGYTDPPMHQACAEASVALCPFVARQKVIRRTEALDFGTDIAVPPGETPGKNDDWVMVKCRQFKSGLTLGSNGNLVRIFVPTGRKITRRYTYVNGRLEEAGPWEG